jgi:hypothetical protein
MACLTNYTVQCKDITSGETGCFFYDQEHWQKTGQFKAISPVYSGLNEFYLNTKQEDRKSLYLERTE